MKAGEVLQETRPTLSGLDSWAAGALTLAVFAFFLVAYGGASFLSAFVPWRFQGGWPLEAALPFLPAASILYLSVVPMMALSPWVLVHRARLFPLAATLIAETAIAAFCFLLFPMASGFPERHADGFWGPFFRFADLLNLERNEVPSLHVAFAVTVALSYGERSGHLGKFLLGIWAAAAAASTLLIHDHHVLDILTGALLAVLCHRFVGRWGRRKDVFQAFEVELLCLRNFVLFGRRHRRYWLIALALYRASLPHWRQRRVLRTGFCFLQEIDDLLDGDRPCEREPLEVVDEVLLALRTRHFDPGSSLHRLAEAFSEDLRKAGGDEALARASQLIGVMQEDRRRVLSGQLLKSDTLRAHHRQTFALSVDLMMIAGGAEVRARDVPELIEAFGWCSTMRDLRDDLSSGLVNIPAEVVQEARSQGAQGLGYEALVSSPTVQAWLLEELSRALCLLDGAGQRLVALGPRRGVGVLRLFHRSIRRFARRRIPKQFPFLPVAPVREKI